MSYKVKGGYRGEVRIKGVRPYTKKFKRRKDADKWERDEKTKVREILTTPGTSLLEASTKYLDYCKSLNYTKSTISDKRKALKELIQATGNIVIEEIEPGIILHDLLMKQDTTALWNKRRKDLGAFFTYCKTFQGLKISPMIDIPKAPRERAHQPVCTTGELAKLLLVAETRQDKNLLIVLANTGARRSEIFRTTFSDDIDFNGRRIRLGSRKNRAREIKYRWVPFDMAPDPEGLEKALRDQFKRRMHNSDYVFQNPDDRHPSFGDRYTARRKWMAGLCKAAKVKRMGFHALRRYFASKLIEQGMDLETIRALMGHGSVSVTDRYIYRLKDDLGEVAVGGTKTNCHI